MGLVVAHQRNRQHGAILDILRGSARVRVFAVEQRNDVGVMDGRPVEHGAAVDGRPPQRHDRVMHRDVIVGGVVGQRAHRLAVAHEHVGEGRAAQARGLRGDRVQYRLDIGGRRGHDAQDLGGRGLLGQGVGEALVGRVAVGGLARA